MSSQKLISGLSPTANRSPSWKTYETSMITKGLPGAVDLIGGVFLLARKFLNCACFTGDNLAGKWKTVISLQSNCKSKKKKKGNSHLWYECQKEIINYQVLWAEVWHVISKWFSSNCCGGFQGHCQNWDKAQQ